MVKKKIDYILQMVQLYSYLLPTVKIGNAIMDFRKLHTLNGDLEEKEHEQKKETK